MEGLIAIMPECIIPCCDLWPPGTLAIHKMQAYKALADEQRISRIRVVYDKTSRNTAIEYMSSLPHDWIIDELREKCTQLMKTQKMDQQKMEV